MPDYFNRISDDPHSSSTPQTENKPDADANVGRKKKGICPFCFTEQVLQAGRPCPNGNCYSNRRGIPLPPEVITHELFPIAIVGAPSSGKSHFLAALKHSLVNEGVWGEGNENGYWKWSFVTYSNPNPVNNNDDQKDNPYIEYEMKLYEMNHTLGSTERQGEHPPMLLSLKYLNPWRRILDEPRMFDMPCFFKKSSLLVSFTDMAGEDTQRGNIDDLERNYPVFKKMLKGAIVMLDTNARAVYTNNMLTFLKDKQKEKEEVPIPIAVCISKIDELTPEKDKIPVEWLDARFDTNTSFAGRLVLPEIESNSESVRKWMKEQDSLKPILDIVKESFPYHAFFATSALGMDPYVLDSEGKPLVVLSNNRSAGAKTLRESSPVPIRVLDPLMWILWQHGYLGGIKKV